MDIGRELRTIRDKKLHPGTFAQYLNDRWSMSRPQGYRLIDAADIIDQLRLSPVGDKQLSQRAIRELVPFKSQPDVLGAVWARAVEDADGGVPTASGIIHARDWHLGVALNTDWRVVRADQHEEWYDICTWLRNADEHAAKTFTYFPDLFPTEVLEVARAARERMLNDDDCDFPGEWAWFELVFYAWRRDRDTDRADLAAARKALVPPEPKMTQEEWDAAVAALKAAAPPSNHLQLMGSLVRVLDHELNTGTRFVPGPAGLTGQMRVLADRLDALTADDAAEDDQ